MGFALAVFSVLVLVAKMPTELLWVTVALPAVLYGAFAFVMPEGLAGAGSFDVVIGIDAGNGAALLQLIEVE